MNKQIVIYIKFYAEINGEIYSLAVIEYSVNFKVFHK